MRIHNRVVIDIATNQVLEDDYFEYEGPIASCDPLATAIGIGGGAAINALTTDQASRRQQESAGKASDIQQAQFAQTREDLAPYRQAGSAALARLTALLGLPSGTSSPDDGSLLRNFSTADLNADPVYNSGLQFGLNEGERAINNRAAAGGSYDSGATLKALTRFANDYGSTKANEAFNRFQVNQGNTYGRLSGIAGLGSGATSVGVNAGTNAANNLSNIATGLGNAQGAAAIAGGNIANTALNNYGNYSLLRQLSGGGQRATDVGMPYTPGYPDPMYQAM